jgi:hypothetical protein
VRAMRLDIGAILLERHFVRELAWTGPMFPWGRPRRRTRDGAPGAHLRRLRAVARAELCGEPVRAEQRILPAGAVTRLQRFHGRSVLYGGFVWARRPLLKKQLKTAVYGPANWRAPIAQGRPTSPGRVQVPHREFGAGRYSSTKFSTFNSYMCLTGTCCLLGLDIRTPSSSYSNNTCRPPCRPSSLD